MGGSRWQMPAQVRMDLASGALYAGQVSGWRAGTPACPLIDDSVPFLWVPAAPLAQSEGEAEVAQGAHALHEMCPPGRSQT